MAVAEGLARRIPAIASDVGGHPEVVGDAGLLVPAGDPAALADALRRWLTDPDLRATLRAAAAARAAELPTWPQIAAVVAGLLADLNRTGADAVLTSRRQRTDR
jgi:glycosyltransferase involved in cell wall biosynthesis